MDTATDVFEISWEICNKVGGIYTVIKSKAADAKAVLGNYLAIGPYFPEKHASEFVEEQIPESFAEAATLLKKEGIVCHYGKWLTDSEIDTILLDFQGFTARKNDVKGQLWDHFKVDSLYTSYFDFDEPVLFAYAAGRLVEEVARSRKTRAIAHCHEWLAGSAVLYLKMSQANVATVFTTHATVLGRTLTSEGVDIYAENVAADLSRPDYRTSVLPKHQVEEQAAKNADVFTTVSPITALEAEKFLGRKPEVLLLNGLNIGKFPTFEEASIKHRLFKGKIKEFLLYYFFPYYTFDIDNTLIYFLASRYEFRAKGIDIFIQALGELNRRLKAEGSSKTVVVFLWVPGDAASVKPELSQSRMVFNDIKDSVTDEHDILMERLLTTIIANRSACDETYLLGEQLISDIRKKLLRFKRTGTPPLSTHNLRNEGSDEILKACVAAELLNRKDDKVKVIFYPIYLTGTDAVLDLTYYEAMQGAHLGVFPSFYEPWGYTPVEAAALGVPSITTDLSGFGRYVYPTCEAKKSPGIMVIKRLGRSDDAATKDLTRVLYRYTMMNAHDRIKNKIEAKRVASVTDWKYFIKNYVKAYSLALEKGEK